MSCKVFIDGRYGTTGLEIDSRLSARAGIEILVIPEAESRDPAARAVCLNEADIVFLCLPDAAAKESASLIRPDNTRPRVLDPSTAHRTHPDWVYGLPELDGGQRQRIKDARRVAVPGCHASGFILLMRPLVAAGIVPTDYPVSVSSITGYSGGGVDMIASYEALSGGEVSIGTIQVFAYEAGAEHMAPAPLPDAMRSPRAYALGLTHKHLPEMKKMTGLAEPPLFTPIVGNFKQGMTVMVPLISRLLPKRPAPADIEAFYREYYAGETFVKVMSADSLEASDNGFLPATACNGTNRVEIFVFGHAEQILLAARFDNLGKGASGAAIQCMNIMLGVDETTGLVA